MREKRPDWFHQSFSVEICHNITSITVDGLSSKEKNNLSCCLASGAACLSVVFMTGVTDKFLSFPLSCSTS